MPRALRLTLAALAAALTLALPVVASADGPSASPTPTPTPPPPATASPAPTPAPTSGREVKRERAIADLQAAIEPDAVGFNDPAFITGRATEPGTDTPIVGAVVSFRDQVDGGPAEDAARTDRDGRFRIAWSPPGWDSVPSEGDLAYVEVAIQSDDWSAGARATYTHLDRPRSPGTPPTPGPTPSPSSSATGGASDVGSTSGTAPPLAQTGGGPLTVVVGGVLATAAGVLLLFRRDHED